MPRDAPPGQEHAQGRAPRSAVIRIRSRTKQIWASRTSGTGLLKSLLAATAKMSIPSPSASWRSSRQRAAGQSSGLPCGRLPSISIPSYPNCLAS